MNDCAREITWAGGKHVFNLNDKRILLMMQVRGLPGQYGNTPLACLRRFEEQTYSTDDVERVMELALMGGGISRQAANALLDTHVRCKPIGPNAVIALTVLTALFAGAEPFTEAANASA